MTVAIDNLSFLHELEEIIKQRKESKSSNSYTSQLFDQGLDAILQKVGEESIEYIIDAKNKNKQRATEEASDLLFHLIMSLAANDIHLQDVVNELQKRNLKKKSYEN